MIKRRLAVLLASTAVILAACGSSWEANAATDPCPADKARANYALEHYYEARLSGNQALITYWWDQYSNAWNIGHVHHCW